MAAALLTGCGSAVRVPTIAPARLPADYLPLPVGRTPAYRLSPTSTAVARRKPIAGMRCADTGSRRFAIHLELYADRLVVPIPSGIGISPPLRHRGAYVTGGACAYPVRSLEPTGVFELTRAGLRLGELFTVWGQPLGPRRLASFHGSVRAYLGGRPWRGDPRRIPLGRHAEIVLEVGAYVPPHPAYLFAPGH